MTQKTNEACIDEQMVWVLGVPDERQRLNGRM